MTESSDDKVIEMDKFFNESISKVFPGRVMKSINRFYHQYQHGDQSLIGSREYFTKIEQFGIDNGWSSAFVNMFKCGKKSVRSIGDTIIKMDGDVFLGELDGRFGETVLMRLNEQCVLYKNGEPFDLKPGKNLLQVIETAVELNWDDEFINSLASCIG